MYKIVVFCLLLVLNSCTLDFDTSQRIAVKGKIVDVNNKPISNIEISVFAIKDGQNSGLGCYNCDFRKIMSGKSNENGDFILFSPIPTNVTRYTILINTNNVNEPWNGISVINPLYKNRRIMDITPNNFIDYIYSSETTILEFNN